MYRNIWRRAGILFMVVGMICTGTQGCKKPDLQGKEKRDKLRIVTTIFPEYDWVMEILGEKAGDAEVALLMGDGSSLHSFQPSPRDVVTISSCDVFIYVGGESDLWVEDVLKDAKNKDMKVICLMEMLGDQVKDEEIAEGMQDEEDHGDDEEKEPHGSEGKDKDEHVWLSIKHAMSFCDQIAEAIGDADPENESIYRENADRYIEELEEMDTRYERAAAESRNHTMIFCDRFPFKYLMEDYGIEYYAAFPGCSSETEASFETITFLSKKADEIQAPCLIGLEKRKHRIAETVAENMKNKNIDILQMDSMQSVTYEDIQNGETYMSVMEDNLSVMEKALR